MDKRKAVFAMDFEKIVRTGISIEIDGIEFYRGSKEKVADENGKGVLEFLAREEERHKAYFEGLLKKHGADPDGLLKALQVPRIFPKAKGFEPGDAGTVDEEILKHAKKAEDMSIDFYTGALKGVRDKELLIGLGIIINEEKQHLQWVEYLLEGVGKNAYWSDLHDHFSLDGG